MIDNSIYTNPLITRYASKEMQHAFSDEKRFKLWRKLWIALAESEMELGINVTQEHTLMISTMNWRLSLKGKVAMTLWHT